MAPDRDGVEGVLTLILRHVPETEVRLVGTASSVLRGIDIPAGDIDLLFRDRAGVDAWFAALSAELEVDAAPDWLAEQRQYFARIRAGDVAVELSTVEIEVDNDTAECLGSGPWEHYDVVSCRDGVVPAVATELRLITEIARAREDRYGPIIDFLRDNGCDIDLVRRGLANLGASQDGVERVVARLSSPSS